MYLVKLAKMLGKIHAPKEFKYITKSVWASSDICMLCKCIYDFVFKPQFTNE